MRPLVDSAFDVGRCLQSGLMATPRARILPVGFSYTPSKALFPLAGAFSAVSGLWEAH